jgi:hypothetical protein
MSAALKVGRIDTYEWKNEQVTQKIQPGSEQHQSCLRQDQRGYGEILERGSQESTTRLQGFNSLALGSN